MITIGLVGMWHLGEIYSACLAELGHQVIGIDENAEVVDKLNNGTPPLTEPLLSNIICKNIKKGRLRYSSSFNDLKKCSVVWLTIDTPIDKSDAANTQIIFSTLKKMAPFLVKKVTLVISSQLPVGSSSKIVKFLKQNGKKINFEYAYVPENLRLGEGVNSFLNAGRIVIGTYNSETYHLVRSILSKIKSQFLKMSVVSAEMVKHATNAFLATSLSFIYDIADVCEKSGADVIDVSRALKADSRIGSKAYLDASVGFSGGTLGRDLQYLLKIAKENHAKLPVINSVFRKNISRKTLVYERILKRLKIFKGKSICFWGITYKSGTSTLRRSLAVEIIKEISKKGAQIIIYDPMALEGEIKKTMGSAKLSIAKNIYDSSLGCHVIVIITPWEDLKNIDFSKLSSRMKSPKIIFDARNFLYTQENEIKKNNIYYMGIGR